MAAALRQLCAPHGGATDAARVHAKGGDGVRKADHAVAAERNVGAAHRVLVLEQVRPVPVGEALAPVRAVLGQL